MAIKPQVKKDAGNPTPRADLDHHQVAGHFKQAIANKKKPCPPTEDHSAQANIGIHGPRGETDVDPVEIGDDVEGNLQRE